jgi:hypothetical protein
MAPQLTNARRRTMSHRPAGRMAAAFKAEESPGSTETRCRTTSGGGNPRESATENKPPQKVRVKWCGKSAPRAWQHGRHGKPHWEQNRIGATQGKPWIRLRIVARVGCLSRPATAGREEWPSRAQLPARLTEPGLQAGWHSCCPGKQPDFLRPPSEASATVRNALPCARLSVSRQLARRMGEQGVNLARL